MAVERFLEAERREEAAAGSWVDVSWGGRARRKRIYPHTEEGVEVWGRGLRGGNGRLLRRFAAPAGPRLSGRFGGLPS